MVWDKSRDGRSNGNAYFEERELVQEAFDDQNAGSAGGNDARIQCPLCEDKTGKADHRGSMSVNLESGFYMCFKCESKGRLEGFTDYDFRDRPEPTERPKLQLPRGFVALEEEHEDSYLYGRAANYAFDRVGSWATIRELGMGIAGNRLIVPVRDGAGAHLGHVAREIPDLEPAYLEGTKYVYPKGFRREHLLFNEAALDVPREEYLLGNLQGLPVVVVEGVFDALPHWPLAVACLGKPTHAQEAILERCRRPLVIMLDGDAWELGKSLAQRLFRQGIECSWVELPPGTDPGNCGMEAMRDVLRAAAQVPGQGLRLRIE